MSEADDKSKGDVIRKWELPIGKEKAKRFIMKAAEAGQYPEDMLLDLIGGLIGETPSHCYSGNKFLNGWFQWYRANIGSTKSFLAYLASQEELEMFTNYVDKIESIKLQMADIQETIQRGTIEGLNHEYYLWSDIQNTDGRQTYSTRKEWEQEEQKYMEQETELVEWYKSRLDEMWNEYKKFAGEESVSYDQELSKIIEWNNRYRSM